ncbi:rhamnose-binding lectin-like [Daphnia pulicaria]|uniref:rhamnose-binding lectin-like n=1 Tax=Daphnia pulicaria TaxID=35523 RepID=UPI001EEB13F4|nr:rhamnose-binding lectin-like [Daphnia pulicaria]
MIRADPLHFICFILVSSLGLLQQVASQTALQSDREIYESFTCEWKTKTLTCPDGQGILIDFANYGRTTHPVCVMDPVRDAPNNCSTPNHTNLVASFCNGMSNCVVPATNEFFGDPCRTIVKYLQINYHCETLIPSAIKESFTCEWQSKTLTCPSGQIIIVDYANYGRTTHPVCVMDPVRDGPNTCGNPSHTSVVASLCIGQSNCVVPATNFVFGDPCPTIVKYLQIQYHCA